MSARVRAQNPRRLHAVVAASESDPNGETLNAGVENRGTRATDPPGAAPKLGRRPRLSTLAEVRQEVGRLYRSARAGVVTASDAAKLGSLLAIAARILEAEDGDARLDAIEEALAQRDSAEAWR